MASPSDLTEARDVEKIRYGEICGDKESISKKSRHCILKIKIGR